MFFTKQRYGIVNLVFIDFFSFFSSIKLYLTNILILVFCSLSKFRIQIIWQIDKRIHKRSFIRYSPWYPYQNCRILKV